MLENTAEAYYKDYNLSRVDVLLVQQDLKDVVNLTELLIDAGVDDTKIHNACNYSALEHYLSIGEVTHIVIDAHLYNYSMSSLINEYNDGQIEVYVNNFENMPKTIRLMTDKLIQYLPQNTSSFEINRMFSQKKFEKVTYIGARKKF